LNPFQTWLLVVLIVGLSMIGYVAFRLLKADLGALARQGNAQAAQQSLQRSLELLPTAVAYHELGVLAERAGDLDTALSHYQTAAQSESPAGQAARARLLRLDLPRNPSRYVDAALARDASGRLVMQVSNRTGAELTDVQVVIETVDAAGKRRQIGRASGRGTG